MTLWVSFEPSGRVHVCVVLRRRSRLSLSLYLAPFFFLVCVFFSRSFSVLTFPNLENGKDINAGGGKYPRLGDVAVGVGGGGGQASQKASRAKRRP